MQAMEYAKHTLTFRSNRAWPDLAEGRSSSSDWETNTLTVIPLPSHLDGSTRVNDLLRSTKAV